MDSKDYFKEIEDRLEKEALQSWIIRFPREIYRTIESWIYRLPDLPRRIKWSYQTLTKGYCDCDIWNLNDFILRKIRKPLKEFVRYQSEEGMGLPMDFETDPAGWLVVLKEIEFAVDDWWKMDNDDNYFKIYCDMDLETKKAHNERVSKGFELFGKYLRSMWD